MADALIVRGTLVGVQKGNVIFDGYVAGEALDAASPVFIVTNKVYMANRTAHNVGAKSGASLYVGFVDRAAAIGEPVAIYGAGTVINYAAATLTSGDPLWIGDTDGRLTTDEQIKTADDGTGTDVDVLVELPVAYCLDTNRIIVVR